MPRIACLALVALAALPVHAADLPKPLVTGLPNPTSVAAGPDGRVYVSVAGQLDKDGDGAVMVVTNGRAVPFAAGLDDPKGLVAWKDDLFVVDKTRVVRIDKTGKTQVFAGAAAFPTPPHSLNDIAVDERGVFYVTDLGRPTLGAGGKVYRISAHGRVDLVADNKSSRALNKPASVVMDGMDHLLVQDFVDGCVLRLRLADKATTPLAGGGGGNCGLTWDFHGRLYYVAGARIVAVIAAPGNEPALLADGFRAVADLCLDPTGKFILVPDWATGTITALPTQVPGAPVDETPLPVENALAFPNLQWAGWTGESDTGKVVTLRPIVLTHAGDGSNRAFVATQRGVVHVFPNDPKATGTRVFLDIQSKVRYDDNTNEEGFLGLAFHPDFKANGEFYVFYTDKRARLTNVLSRFRVSKDDPNRADPASEEQLLRVPRPFWNHDGGTIVFGPDGYLYLALGDGGAANDPLGNGQNLQTWLGKVLRIDVNRTDNGRPYAIPKDNPFVGRADARPEIWCYGLRNVWRMAFDRKTGQLWAGEVGQNLYEEVVILRKGGNYGWNLRESLHPFGARGADVRADLIDPIWEYHHDVGKSITGGHVYRGRDLPELDGMYLYADYVGGQVWALRYDEQSKRVTANRPIPGQRLPWISFGEDERGEAYLLTYSPSGQGVFRLVRKQQR
jgi:glucose/arabinose dehydrogenase